MAVHRVGAASILMRKFDAEAVLRLIETHRVTHAQFVPTMFVRMLKLPEDVREKYDVSSLQCVIHAAAPCPVDVKHRMMEWFGPIIHEYYGGTEGFAGTIIGPEEWLAHPGSVGKPFSPVHVVGEDGDELAGRRVRRALLRRRTGVRVLQGSREDGVGVQRPRVAIAGRHGLRRRGRLPVPHRPLDVHDRLRRGEHLPAGGGEPSGHASRSSSTRRCSACRTTSSARRSRPSCNRSTASRPGPTLEAELIEYCRANLAALQVPAHGRVRSRTCRATRTASSTSGESASATGRGARRASCESGTPKRTFGRESASNARHFVDLGD